MSQLIYNNLFDNYEDKINAIITVPILFSCICKELRFFMFKENYKLLQKRKCG